MSEKGSKKVDGVTYKAMDKAYYDSRTLERHAGVWSLWALGVGAVISGHFSGWNLGVEFGGWGGMIVATTLIAIMYIGLSQSVAEMSPSLPGAGGAYAFGRFALGPWGGFATGLAENLEFVITPAVIVFFISSYMGSIFETPDAFMPVWWLGFYIFFMVLNIVGSEMSFKFTLGITALALLCLVVFWASAFISGDLDFSKNVMNIAAGTDGKPMLLENGGGEFLPFGITGAFAAMPFAVWLFLAIEQMPLATEEAVNPVRDMPKALSFAIATLVLSAFLVVWLNSAIVGSYQVYQVGDPLLEGYGVLFKTGVAKGLGIIVVVGLIASFHTIIFAFGRQIFCLSRAGYFPTFLSKTHPTRKTPYIALMTGSGVGFAVLMITYYFAGDDSGNLIGGTLMNVAVFSAMISYIMQSTSFLALRKTRPNLERPYRSPMGKVGAYLTIAIALLTMAYQFQDPSYRVAVICTIVYISLGLVYFAVSGKNKLILTPEQEFAMETLEREARLKEEQQAS